MSDWRDANKPAKPGTRDRAHDSIICRCGATMRIMMASRHQITAYHCPKCGTGAVKDPRLSDKQVDWYEVAV